MALQPGTRLGSFEVLGPLGAGGMGEVYRAHDSRLGRDVAIKVLPEAFARDPARAARFEREARLLAAINHPAIAAIYGAEELDSVRCIIMELVPGETLAERLTRGALPLGETLGIARQIAEALEAAHEKGVVHRDLKPANIKITPEERVKVLDLGLAKAMEVPSGEDLSQSPTLAGDQTRPGVILGTVEFMSPEQARGKSVDKRTDIWAFGCILYEMLSGRRAFTGETATDVLAAILSAEPDWSRLPAATPARLRELLSRCLQKDANKRLRDIGDARLEIERAREESAPAATPLAAARRRWPAAALMLIGLLAAAAVWLRLRSSPAAQAELPERKQLAVLPFRNLTGDDNARLMGVAFVDTISVRLSGLPGLQVVTPSAVVEAVDHNNGDAGATGQPANVLRTARELGATLIVYGTFQRQGDRVRITYHVVNVGTGAQIAANALEGLASDLFSLQDTLADTVAKDLHFSGARRRQTVSPGLDADQQAQYLQAVGLMQRYDRRDAVERALEILRGLAGERPNSAPVQAALGRASLAMFDFTKDRAWADRAISSADAARSLDPALPEVDVTVGETLLTTGRATEAAQAFRRALAANADDFQALLGLGRASESAGDGAAAEAAFRRAILLQPSSFAAYNQFGAVFAGRGRWSDAAQMFRKAASLAPDSYRVWSNLGGVSTMGCDFTGALEAFGKALALQPNNAIAASNLGVTQLWMGRYGEAVASLELAARQAPNDYRVRVNLGDAYRAVLGRAARAAEAYESAIALARAQLRLNARDATAHSYAATSLAKTNRPAEAAAESRQALELDPKDPGILLDAAVVAALAGRTAEAIGSLRKAVEAGYCRDIIARQPEFERFRKDPEFQTIIAAPPRAAGI
jgi:Flp pilus assembly protein TadD/TolB-like protein